MKISTKRTLAAVAGAFIAMVGAWTTGIPLDERGLSLFIAYVCVVLVTGWGWLFPFDKED